MSWLSKRNNSKRDNFDRVNFQPDRKFTDFVESTGGHDTQLMWLAKPVQRGFSKTVSGFFQPKNRINTIMINAARLVIIVTVIGALLSFFKDIWPPAAGLNEMLFGLPLGVAAGLLIVMVGSKILLYFYNQHRKYSRTIYAASSDGLFVRVFTGGHYSNEFAVNKEVYYFVDFDEILSIVYIKSDKGTGKINIYTRTVNKKYYTFDLNTNEKREGIVIEGVPNIESVAEFLNNLRVEARLKKIKGDLERLPS